VSNNSYPYLSLLIYAKKQHLLTVLTSLLTLAQHSNKHRIHRTWSNINHSVKEISDLAESRPNTYQPTVGFITSHMTRALIVMLRKPG